MGTETDRIITVMNLLVDEYHYPVPGAAGIVGNLIAESGVMPNRIEGSRATSPMRAEDFDGVLQTFTPSEIRARDSQAQRGPRLPGVGIAQWTSRDRRAGLFTHVHAGRSPGAGILSDLPAQVDYLVAELAGSYRSVDKFLRFSDVTTEAASDEVVYRFEVPGAVLEAGRLLPRNHPSVQRVFTVRRTHAQRAYAIYRTVHV